MYIHSLQNISMELAWLSKPSNRRRTVPWWMRKSDILNRRLQTARRANTDVFANRRDEFKTQHFRRRESGKARNSTRIPFPFELQKPYCVSEFENSDESFIGPVEIFARTVKGHSLAGNPSSKLRRESPLSSGDRVLLGKARSNNNNDKQKYQSSTPSR